MELPRITMPVILHITSLPQGITVDILKEYFSQYDSELKLTIIKDPEQREPPYALVRFQDSSRAEQVLRETNHVILNQTVKVAKNVKATPPAPVQCDPRKIFVGGLPLSITVDEVENFFRQFGEIIECFMPPDRETRQSRQFAFVKFRSAASVNMILGVHEHAYFQLRGKTVEVKRAIPKEPIENGWSNHGGGGVGRTWCVLCKLLVNNDYLERHYMDHHYIPRI